MTDHLQRRRQRRLEREQRRAAYVPRLTDHHRTSLALAIAEALGSSKAADRLADELAAIQIDPA